MAISNRSRKNTGTRSSTTVSLTKAVRAVTPSTKKKKKKPTKKPDPWKAIENIANDDDYLTAALEIAEKEHAHDPINKAHAVKWSVQHDRLRERQLSLFTSTLMSMPEKYPGANVMVTFYGRKVPRLIQILSGQKNYNKIKMANMVFIDFFHSMKKKKVLNGACPVLSPNTQMTYVRTLFGALKDTFDWQYSLEEDFNFRGGLIAVINSVFKERKEKYGKEFKYGEPKALKAGHKLRHSFIATLSNDAGVSVEESMAASRHNSVAAQRAYISEANRSSLWELRQRRIPTSRNKCFW